MKSNPKATAEYDNFQSALKTVLSVPRSEMQRREQEYQEQQAGKKKRGPKPSSSARASREKD